jgi:diguanylate cyclase (GGDEF)-like protein
MTEDFKLREELRERALYDLPTGCLNHASVMAAVADRLPPPANERTAALFLDLDEFKETNDRYGHAAGDVVLRAVADRLRAVARDGDVVGRLGGDEFLLVMRTAADRSAAARIASRVSRAVNRAVPWGDGEIPVSASVGVSSAAAGSTATADNLVSAADSAMYESKRRGSGPVVAEL